MSDQAVDLFIGIEKIDEEQRLVYGVVSSPTVDGQPGIWKGQAYEGDQIDAQAMAAALDDYMQWANLREMHQSSAVGTVEKAWMEGDETHIIARVVDDAAWEKIKKGVYKGFSIGASVLSGGMALVKDGGRMIRRITRLLLKEISLVDRPANPDAKILLWKGATMSQQLQKAAEPTKVIGQIQALRNECELAGDLEGAQLYTQAIAVVLQAAGEADPPAAPAEPDGDDEIEEGADPATPDAASESDDEELAMSASGHLRKAGRTFSGKNSGSMHDVVKALATMMAGAGDETAKKVLACYGGGDPVATAEKAASAAGEAIEKALLPALEQQNQAMLAELQKMAQRIDHLERQPAAGGPALRGQVINKSLGSGDSRAAALASEITQLRKAAATEPDPLKRAEYTRKLNAAELNLNQLKKAS